MSRYFQKIFRQSSAAFILLGILLLNTPLALSADYGLTVSNPNKGSGTVSGTIGFTLGSEDQFFGIWPEGAVSLAATADWKSIFEGWGAVSGSICTVTGTTCDLVLDANTELTATFSPNLQAHLVSSEMPQQYYSTLAGAYADATVIKFNIVACEYTFRENLVLDKPIHIFFGGGRLALGYLSHRDDHFTTILGSLEIQQGSLEIDSLIIQ